jgi:hypothetical protein
MADDIVEGLSDTKKGLSYVMSGAHGVNRLGRGRVGSVKAHGAGFDRHAQDLTDACTQGWVAWSVDSVVASVA